MLSLPSIPVAGHRRPALSLVIHLHLTVHSSSCQHTQTAPPQYLAQVLPQAPAPGPCRVHQPLSLPTHCHAWRDVWLLDMPGVWCFIPSLYCCLVKTNTNNKQQTTKKHKWVLGSPGQCKGSPSPLAFQRGNYIVGLQDLPGLRWLFWLPVSLWSGQDAAPFINTAASGRARAGGRSAGRRRDEWPSLVQHRSVTCRGHSGRKSHK